MAVLAVIVDYEDRTIRHQVREEDDKYIIESYKREGGVFYTELFLCNEYSDKVSAYLAAMTAYIQLVGDMTAGIKPIGKKPSSFSLAMYVDDPAPEPNVNKDIYVSSGATAKKAAVSLGKMVDAVGEWDFDELMDMGLPMSVIALGDNPNGVTVVWVELIIL